MRTVQETAEFLRAAVQERVPYARAVACEDERGAWLVTVSWREYEVTMRVTKPNAIWLSFGLAYDDAAAVAKQTVDFLHQAEVQTVESSGETN